MGKGFLGRKEMWFEICLLREKEEFVFLLNSWPIRSVAQKGNS